jgi:hypothetical protein
MQDKSMTGSAGSPRKRKPVAVVKQGSAAVPIYRGTVRDATRFTVAFYMNGRRQRRTFGSLDAAREEARMASLNIQRGMSHDNDMRPQDREAFRAAQAMLSGLGVPLVVAVDEYVQCRRKLGEVPLLSSVDEYVRRSQGFTPGVLVGRVVDELIAVKTQDRVSQHHLLMLAGQFRRFKETFPGEISKVTSLQIDAWLRRGDHSMVTRNNWLKRVKELFSFARRRACLPKGEPTAAESLVRRSLLDHRRFHPQISLR